MRMGQELTLFEPVPIEDEICAGLALVEQAYGCARFVFYSRQRCYEAGGVELCAVRRKLILPYTAVWPSIVTATAFMAEIGVGRVLAR